MKAISWEGVAKNAESAWGARIVETIKREYAEHNDKYNEPPTLLRSEWGHHYYCESCGVKLIFDILKPHSHVCSGCGREHTGYPYDGTWRKYLHNAIMQNMERAAILSHLEKGQIDGYKQYIHDNILFYANHYDQYEPYGKHAGIGKVYPQSLSEAIFVINFERIMRMSEDLNIFTEAELTIIGEKFFRPAAELIKPQIDKIHNIHAWMQGALAAAASFLKDKDALNEAIYGELGWVNQLDKGTTKEGIWYEISDCYHYYTISALTGLAWVAYENGIDLFANEKYRLMMTNFPKLAYPDGTLPALNDGWFGGSLLSRAPLYEELSCVMPELLPILSGFYGDDADRNRTSLQALLYGKTELPAPTHAKPESFVFEDTGIAVLQNDRLRVSLKFSGDGGGHDHNDKLSIELFANGRYLSYDPGTTGYALPFTKQWSRTSLAHNMLCVDGKPQNRCAAVLCRFDNSFVSAFTDKAYDGFRLMRELRLLHNGFIDYFTAVTSDESSHTFDWIFHCKGSLSSDLVFAPIEPGDLFEGNGYDQLADVKKAAVKNAFHVVFRHDDIEVIMRFDLANATVFTGRCYGANMVDIMPFIMIRQTGSSMKLRQTTTIA